MNCVWRNCCLRSGISDPDVGHVGSVDGGHGVSGTGVAGTDGGGAGKMGH